MTIFFEIIVRYMKISSLIQPMYLLILSIYLHFFWFLDLICTIKKFLTFIKIQNLWSSISHHKHKRLLQNMDARKNYNFILKLPQATLTLENEDLKSSLHTNFDIAYWFTRSQWVKIPHTHISLLDNAPN